MHLKHALSCGDSGSSYIFSTLPPMELAVHHNDVSSTRSSCGDSGSSKTLNTAPPSPLGRNRFTILLNSPPHHISGTRPLICQFRFFTFAKVLNPPPNFSQARGRGRAEKESGGVWGAQPPQFATTMSLSAVLKGSICALFLLAGCHFQANVHGG